MRWGELVEEGSKIVLTGNGHEAEYVFGKVYKYFLGQFGIDDAKKGGQFYAPASVLKICFEVLTACRQKLRSMLAVRGMAGCLCSRTPKPLPEITTKPITICAHIHDIRFTHGKIQL